MEPTAPRSKEWAKERTTPRRWRIFWWTLAGLIFAGFVVALYIAKAVNEGIDLCDDPTSGRYITDPLQRADLCKQSGAAEGYARK